MAKTLQYLLKEVCRSGGYSCTKEQAINKGYSHFLVFHYQDQKYWIKWENVMNGGRSNAFDLEKGLQFSRMAAFLEGLTIGLKGKL